MYSFDVFDTLITRTTATPKGIFALMQQELLKNQAYQSISNYIRENFYYLRINAEVLASVYFRKGDIEEITLEQIYEALSMNGTLSFQDRQLLIKLEKNMEYRNSIGITDNINKIKKLREQGEHIVLISDMYLDSNTIKELLIKADEIFREIPLYVSSEYKKCKWNGKLFQLVKEIEKLEYHNWKHIGDNKKVDVTAAEALGIQTELYPYLELTPYEKEKLLQKEDDAYIQLTVGAARNSRLFFRLSGPGAMGCSIGGVILFPYVWWLLQQSLERGIKRLYFIARDGYILKNIADIIIKQRDLEIQTYYIYGSRRAWRMASVSEKTEDLDAMIEGSYFCHVSSIEELADLFQLSKEELLEFYPAFNGIDPYYIASPVIRDFIRRSFLDRKDNFSQYLNNKHKVRRQLVTEYLRQEINWNNDQFAFVEMAGSGITQGCLAELMQEFYKKPIQTFFFKLDRVKSPANCIFYNYLPSLLQQHILLEMLTRAPHGQTIGYKKSGDRIEPVLSEVEVQALIDHGIEYYFDGIKSFTEIYLSALVQNQKNADNIELTLSYMDYLTKKPDQEVLNFFGGMPNSVTGREKQVIEYAPVLSQKDIRTMFLTRLDEPIEMLYQGTSFDYSLIRSGEKIRRRIDFYQKNYHKFLGKAARLPKRLQRKLHHNDRDSIFPFGFLRGRIILYAAGKAGKTIYQELKHRNTCEIVQWADTKHEELSKCGLPVTSPDLIGRIPYDYIIIAVYQKQQADSIKTLLLSKGIQEERIIWMNLRA